MRILAVGPMIVLLVGCSAHGGSSSGDGPGSVAESRLEFESDELAGLCESMLADFAAGESSPHETEQQAVDQFESDHAILDGLTVSNGTIRLREARVGEYRVVGRPEGTFAVESAQWCYPGK